MIRVLPLLGLALAAATALSAQQADRALPPRASFHVFLLVGQSNMAGRGVVAAQDPPVTSRVLMLDRHDRWVPAADPMHFDKPIAGVGLGRAFAARIAETSPDITIGLVPAAVGGSPISAWRPGAYDEPTRTHPWDDAIRRARVALRDGTLAGILWHQGESDATPELAPRYEAALLDLVNRFRTTLAAPQVPFVLGQLGQFDESPWDASRRAIDDVHRSLPSRVAGTSYVSSAGLRHGGDRLHFDAASLRELGRRYADAYLALPR